MLDTGNTLAADAEQARRAIEGGTMARKRFQRGSLFQRGKRQRVWVARWWEDCIKSDGKIGRRRRAEVIGTVASLPTRRKAMQALSERLRLINSGNHKPQSARQLEDFVRKDWMPVVLPTLKYATQKHYRYLLNVHLLPAFGQVQLCDISRESVQAFLGAKLNSGLAWKTVKHLRAALCRVMGTAEEWGYVADNPARRTRLPRRQMGQGRPTILTPAQIRQLAAELREPTRSLVLLLALTGLRVGELLALRWGSLDLQNRVLGVNETVYDGHFDTPKTRRSARSIPLGPEAAAILERLRPQQANSDALVFHTRTGQPLDRRNLLRRHLRPACVRLRLPEVGWHSLRHSHATMLDAVGAPLGTIQAQLGHATAEITREVYVHPIPEDHRRAVEGVERLVFGPKWTQVAESTEESKLVIH